MSFISNIISVWKLNKADLQTINHIQKERLQKLIGHARKNSPYFAHLYKDIPEKVTDITQLPSTEKHELMTNFNDWVTDKDLTIGDLRTFVSKTETIGDIYLNKYYVCTTSGTTGEPAIIDQDKHSRQVYNSIGLLRLLLSRISLFLHFSISI